MRDWKGQGGVSKEAMTRAEYMRKHYDNEDEDDKTKVLKRAPQWSQTTTKGSRT